MKTVCAHYVATKQVEYTWCERNACCKKQHIFDYRLLLVRSGTSTFSLFKRFALVMNIQKHTLVCFGPSIIDVIMVQSLSF